MYDGSERCCQVSQILFHPRSRIDACSVRCMIVSYAIPVASYLMSGQIRKRKKSISVLSS
jgi:hypothetical protein